MHTKEQLPGEFSLQNKVEKVDPQHLRQQEAILKITQRALRVKDLDKFFSEVLDLAVATVDADAGLILESLPEQKQFLVKSKVGTLPIGGDSSPVEEALFVQAGLTLENDHFQSNEDLLANELLRDNQANRDQAAVSALTVMIPGREEPYGVLAIVQGARRPFFRHQINFLQKVSNLLALAIDQQRMSSARTFRGQLAAIMENIVEGITVQDKQGHFLYANDIAASLMGFEDREALLNSTPAAILERFAMYDERGVPLQKEHFPWRRALAGEKGVSQVIRMEEKQNGAVLWLMVRSSVMLDLFDDSHSVVSIFQNITAVKQTEDDQRFLAEVGEMLVGILDYEAALRNIAHLSIKYLADWCAIHLVETDGAIVEFTAAHRDPLKATAASDLQREYPPDPENPEGVYRVIRTGEPLFWPEITEARLRSMARDPEHLHRLNALGIKAAFSLPLIARGHTLGAISLVWGSSKPSYGEREIQLGLELAHRAALAIDNMRLYKEASALNLKLEAKVAERTNQLEELISELYAEIEDRMKVENDLQKSSTLFSSLFELFPDGVFLVNTAGEIVHTNAQSEKLFGYTRSELVGSQIEMLMPSPSLAHHLHHPQKYQQARVQQSLDGGKQLWGLHKNNGKFPIEIVLSSIQIGDEWLMLSTVRNITAQLNAQAEEAEVQHRLMDSQEAQRLMLAQELHDDIIQELFNINFQLAEVEQDLAEMECDSLGEKIKLTSELNQHVIQSLRNISQGLRPPALTPFGLEQAIYSHMERFQQMHPDIAVYLDLTPDGQLLDERMRLTLFRIFQNAVSNVARHAEATKLEVFLYLGDKKVTLEIYDNGKGFNVPKRWVEMVRQGHLGLVGMRERVEAVNGEIKISSKPGKGTRIQVSVPF